MKTHDNVLVSFTLLAEVNEALQHGEALDKREALETLETLLQETDEARGVVPHGYKTLTLEECTGGFPS